MLFKFQFPSIYLMHCSWWFEYMVEDWLEVVFSVVQVFEFVNNFWVLYFWNFKTKDMQLLVFGKEKRKEKSESKNWWFSWKSQQRIVSFLAGSFIVFHSCENGGYVSKPFSDFMRTVVIELKNHLDNLWGLGSTFNACTTLAISLPSSLRLEDDIIISSCG